MVREFYEVKAKLRDFNSDTFGRMHERRGMLNQKEELLLQIKAELDNSSKTKREEIKNRLWTELGVMV